MAQSRARTRQPSTPTSSPAPSKKYPSVRPVSASRSDQTSAGSSPGGTRLKNGLSPDDFIYSDELLKLIMEPLSLSDEEDTSDSDIEVTLIPPRPQSRHDDPIASAIARSLHSMPPTRRPGQAKKTGKYEAYVVFRGHQPGVYQEWAAASHQLVGCRNACIKGYHTLTEARDHWSWAKANGTGGNVDHKGAIIQVPPDIRNAPHKVPVLQEENNISDGDSYATAPSSPENPSSPLPSITINQVHSCPKPSKTEPKSRVIKKKAGHDNVVERCSHHRAKYPNSRPMRQVPREGLSKTYALSYKNIPRRSDLPPTEGYDPDRQALVVLWGEHPGIYFGREAAERGLGSANREAGWLELAGDRAQAQAIFTTAFMHGLVEYI